MTDAIAASCARWRIAMADETRQMTLTGEVQSTLSTTDRQTRVGHWLKDDCTVYVGRSANDGHLLTIPIGDRGWLGNPYPVDEYGREECIERFREAFESRLDEDPAFRAAVRDLHGGILGCWCQSLEDNNPSCHGEVIAEGADRLANKVSGE